MTATPYYLRPQDTKLPAGEDPTLRPPPSPINPLLQAARAAKLQRVDTSPGPAGVPDPPPPSPTTDPMVRKLAPFVWPRKPIPGAPYQERESAPPTTDPMVRKLAPFVWPRNVAPTFPHSHEAAEALAALDPDIALWPAVTLSIWPWTGPPTTGTWPTGWAGIDNTATIYVCTAAPDTWTALVGVTPGEYVPIAGDVEIIVDPNGTGAPGLAFKFSPNATLGAIAAPVYDHLGNLIGGVNDTGGWKTYGDRTQAGTGEAGPFIALDGTTNPPSLLGPSTVYGAGSRVWIWAGTPTASWVSGTTNVGDLWWDTTTNIWYICTVSGAGTTAGTWAFNTVYGATGTAAAPGIAFALDPTTGVYLVQPFGISCLAFALGGNEIIQLNPTALYPVTDNAVELGGAVTRFQNVVSVAFNAAAGTATAPAFAFITDPETGLFNPATGQIGVAIEGVQVGEFTANGLTVSTKAASSTAVNARATLRPAAWISDSMDRTTVDVLTIAAVASGTERMQAIYLEAGTVVSNIIFEMGSTVTATPTHHWAALYDNNRNQLAVSADKTTTAIATNSAASYPIATTAAGAATSFTTTYSGLYYIGHVVVASTMPTYSGKTSTATNVLGTAPVLSGSSDTAITGGPPAFPHQTSTLSVLQSVYAGVS